MKKIIVAICLMGMIPSLQAASFENLLQPLKSRSDEWICKSTSEYSCISKGCNAAFSGLDILLASKYGYLSIYHRCDVKGCDKYSTHASQSGIYTTITLDGHPGIFLKVKNDGSEFTEVASLGTDIYMKFGSCEPVEED